MPTCCGAVLRLAVSESAGLSPLGDSTLASLPTADDVAVDRLACDLAIPSNLHEINAGLLEGAIRCGDQGRVLAKEAGVDPNNAVALDVTVA